MIQEVPLHVDLILKSIDECKDQGFFCSAKFGYQASASIDLIIPPLTFLDQKDETTFDLNFEVSAYAKPSLYLEFKSQDKFLDYEINHQIILEPLYFSSKKLLHSDLKITNIYTDNGFLESVFSNFISDVSHFQGTHTLLILMDSRGSCIKNNDFMPRKSSKNYPWPQFQDNCVIQVDFVVDEKTKLQFLTGFHTKMTILKLFFNQHNIVHALGVKNNVKDNSIDFYYSDGNAQVKRNANLLLTLPNFQRIKMAKEKFYSDFNWVLNLSWSSIFHLDAYNQYLERENFDLSPTIREFNLVLYDPYRTAIFKQALGSIYADVEDWLDAGKIARNLAIICKNLLNELETYSIKGKEYFRVIIAAEKDVDLMVETIFKGLV